MADKKSNGAQNIDGVLEQLKRSYSKQSDGADDVVESESASDDVSHDELQAMLRSQFMSGEEQSVESDDDGYSIDEDFLADAYTEDEGVDEVDEVDEADEFSEEYQDEEEKYYGIYEGYGKGNKEDALEEEIYEEDEADKEATLYQEPEEGYQEEYQDDEEIIAPQGFQALQEEAYYEADEEIYEAEENQEIQEGSGKSIQINPLFHKNAENAYFEDDEDYSLWNEDESYTPIVLDDIEDEDGESTFELTEDTRTDAEKSEHNYVGAFYHVGSTDPYENMPFKDRIAENAPTVDSLEARLDKPSNAEFSLDDFEEFDEFDEVESIPLALDDDAADFDSPLEEASSASKIPADIDSLDRSDLALLLEFGYGADVLRNVSDERMSGISSEELMDEIAEADAEQADDAKATEMSDAEKQEKAKKEEQSRFERLSRKLNKQYDVYRKKRSGILTRLIISSVIAFVLLIYEVISVLDVDIGGIFNRERYFVAYALVGLQLLIFVALPAIKSIYESFQRIFTSHIDGYFIAGLSLIVTVLYDFVVVFERKEIPPTFHFCAALVIVFAELSELMRLVSEIRGYEYYFMEYLFDDTTEVEKIKYTLLKSEGRGSIAEKMYLGGLDEKTLVYAPQNVEAASGFFDASDVESRKNRATFGWIAAAIVSAFILTIVSGIIYEEAWVAAAAFALTFNLMMPITALVLEWAPFERLSKQNYAYGAAFASEGSAESIDKCDMIVFDVLHIFEECSSKSVNLAMYDSTPKAVLLSCLNSVYSEVGGPLKSAFSSINVQPLGACKISRVAKGGIEALVGSSYSVLIGDEQFMARYGISFPDAVLARYEDKIFTLCVSINNRASARIAVKYKINETFYSIVQKLGEDKISCAVQTYDPMISAELIARLRPFKGAPINVVHKSAVDYSLEQHKHKASALYSVMGEDLCVIARGSRLNLAVALSNAKKLSRLRKLINICSGALICLGAFSALMLVLSEKLMTVNWLVVLAYWLISGAIMAGLTAWKFPQRDRFIFNKRK